MIVNIEHNPYQGSLQLLIDGQPRPRLSRFADKPFSIWHKDIVDAIDSEANEEYEVEITSLNTEFVVMNGLFSESKYCKKISRKTFSENMSSENRIQLLENVYDEYTNIDICVCLLSSLGGQVRLSDIKKILSSILFSNDIWNIRVINTPPRKVYDNPNSSEYLFFISESEHDIDRTIIDAAKRGYYSNICLILLNDTDIVKFFSGYLTFCCNKKDWKMVFKRAVECIVVGDIFRSCYYKGDISVKENSCFQIKKKPTIKIPDMVEQGKSKEIMVVSSSAADSNIDIAIRDYSVLRSEGNKLIGVSEGITNVKVFEGGTSQLLKSKDVIVRFVPYIKELFPSDVDLRHGSSLVLDEKQSCRIDYRFAPENSENIDKIRWTSDNTKIAKVHSTNGMITALHHGRCNISCNAGNVGFTVILEVRQNATSIEIDNVYGGEIVMLVNENLLLKYNVIPSGSHYGNIIIRSHDDGVVKINNNELVAVSVGETYVTVEEDLNMVNCTVRVKVIKEKARGFFTRFLNK